MNFSSLYHNKLISPYAFDFDHTWMYICMLYTGSTSPEHSMFTTLHKNIIFFKCYCFFIGSTMPVWVHSTTCICRKNTASSQGLCPASLHVRDSVLSICLCSTLLEYACWRDHYFADQQDLYTVRRTSTLRKRFGNAHQ
jgi:hypothetical protein